MAFTGIERRSTKIETFLSARIMERSWDRALPDSNIVANVFYLLLVLFTSGY